MHINIDAENDSEEEDEEEENIMRIMTVLDSFLFFYYNIKEDRFIHPIDAILIKTEDPEKNIIFNYLESVLDEFTGEAQIINLYLEIITILCQNEANKFDLVKLRENIDLAGKMNLKHIGISEKSRILLTLLQ